MRRRPFHETCEVCGCLSWRKALERIRRIKKKSPACLTGLCASGNRKGDIEAVPFLSAKFCERYRSTVRKVSTIVVKVGKPRGAHCDRAVCLGGGDGGAVPPGRPAPPRPPHPPP